MAWFAMATGWSHSLLGELPAEIWALHATVGAPGSDE